MGPTGTPRRLFPHMRSALMRSVGSSCRTPSASPLTRQYHAHHDDVPDDHGARHVPLPPRRSTDKAETAREGPPGPRRTWQTYPSSMLTGADSCGAWTRPPPQARCYPRGRDLGGTKCGIALFPPGSLESVSRAVYTCAGPRLARDIVADLLTILFRPLSSGRASASRARHADQRADHESRGGSTRPRSSDRCTLRLAAHDLQATARSLSVAGRVFSSLQDGKRPEQRHYRVTRAGTASRAILVSGGARLSRVALRGRPHRLRTDDREEIELLALLRAKYGHHVSYYRRLSGGGIGRISTTSSGAARRAPSIASDSDRNTAITDAALAHPRIRTRSARSTVRREPRRRRPATSRCAPCQPRAS